MIDRTHVTPASHVHIGNAVFAVFAIFCGGVAAMPADETTPATPPETAAKKAVDEEAAPPGDEIFSRPSLLRIRLSIAPERETILRETPRRWVRATVTIDGREYAEAAVRLKGVTSFVPLDKKPSWTLDLARYVPGRTAYGMRRLHLNNSVQDSSFACEDLSSELFRRAGVPAARTAWAKVRLNDRELGLYVVKESFDKEFLRRHFANDDGNLYECGTHQDIFDALERDSGHGVRDRSDLAALLHASQIPDPGARWQALEKVIDLERFISMMVLENLTCHVDGYSRMQNNFRIYFDPAREGKAVFLACGLDRMFGEPEAPLEVEPRAALSLALWSIPEARKRYRERLHELVATVFHPEWLSARLDAIAALIEPVDDVAARDARILKARVLARVAFVEKALRGMGPIGE